MPPQRTRRRVILIAVTAALALWAVAAGWLVLSARDDAEQGLDAMEDFRSLGSEDIATFVDSVGGQVDDVQEETGAVRLAAAADSFERANDAISSPILFPVRFVPVIGRQLRSVDALSAAAATTARSASVAFADLTTILDQSTHRPDDRLATTAYAEEVLVTLQDDLTGLDLGPSEALVGPLARARARFVDEYEQVTSTLDTAVTAVSGVRSFLDGPNRYLVMAANNAEMRAGSGMFLQMGTMDVDDGRFELGEFEATADLKLPAPGAELDPDLAQIWGPLEPNRDWRNLNVSPRFDESARMASEMWGAAGRGEIQGVMAIDIVGLQRLLELIGPVEIQGDDGPVTISADNVESELLLEQYAGADDDDVTNERRAQLGRVAAAVFQSFNERGISATQLLQVLQDMGEGRHLLMWSNVPEQQAGWEALRASGILSENDLMVSVLNRGGNKLDQFLSTSSTLTAVEADGVRRISVQVDMSNSAPEGLPRYVVGPFPGTDLAAGEYLGLLSVTVPGGAGNPAVEGAELVAAGPDEATKVIVSNVRIPRGTRSVVTVSFDLPTSWPTVEVLPSARIPPMTWTAGGQSWTDDRVHVVELDTLG